MPYILQVLLGFTKMKIPEGAQGWRNTQSQRASAREGIDSEVIMKRMPLRDY